MTASSRFLAVTLLLAAGLAIGPARAAESYDNCTGFIDSLPVTITTQGTWCLRGNLGTNITSGQAIRIAANNVTVDCNDFKVGGLAAGDAAETVGIAAEHRQNTTVRHCNVRGFRIGIMLYEGAGHLVEDNRLDNNLFMGINLTGTNSRVRRNVVQDTGGFAGGAFTYAIGARGDVVDNTVSGVFADEPDGWLAGITVKGHGAQVRGNLVSNIASSVAQGGMAGNAQGIALEGRHQRASGNQVIRGSSGAAPSEGISTIHPAFCLDNTVAGFASNIENLCTGSGNVLLP